MSEPYRNPRPVVLLRPLPGTSAVHELWAGTKLLALLAFSALLSLHSTWTSLGLVAATALLTARLVRAPRSALPTIPRWVWAVVALSAVVASLGVRPPIVDVGPLSLGLGGLLAFLRLTALALVLLGLCLLVSWTTHVADIAPAIAVLGRPLTHIGVPIDEWATTTALTFRSFPMLIGELRLLHAARKLRPQLGPKPRWWQIRRSAIELMDLIASAISATLRRGDEMGDAITARGGCVTVPAASARPRRGDWAALGIVAVVCVCGALDKQLLTLVFG